MKKIILFLLSAMFMVSCADSENSQDSSMLKSVDFQYKNIESILKSGNFIDFSPIINLSKFSQSEINLYPSSYLFDFRYGEASDQTVTDLLSKVQLQVSNEIFSVVFYSNDSDDNQLAVNSVNYVSVFWYNSLEKKYNHNLLKKENGIFEEVSLYNSKSNSMITPATIEVLANNLVGVKSVLFVYDEKSSNYEIDRTDPDYGFERTVINNGVIGYRHPPCSMMVCKLDLETLNCGIDPDGGGLDCGVPGSGGAGIGDCDYFQGDDDNVEAPGDSGGEVEETDPSFVEKSAYSIRDNFLSNSSKGRDYINYYYFVGRVVSANGLKVSIREYPAYFELAYKINNLGRKLMSEDGMNDILIDDSDYNYYINFIDTKYVGVSQNTEYQSVLSKVKSDFAKYKNLTKRQILDDFTAN